MPNMHKIGTHHTTLETDALGRTRVTYHSTAIVLFDRTTITLDTGGWNTVTTKNRMNQAANQFNLGFGVYQRHGEWFVDYEGYVVPFNSERLVLTRRALPVIADNCGLPQPPKRYIDACLTIEANVSDANKAFYLECLSNKPMSKRMTNRELHDGCILTHQVYVPLLKNREVTPCQNTN